MTDTSPEPVFSVLPTKGDNWAVCLPHQCQTWDIAGEGDYPSGVPHAEALAELDAFIADAQRAREALATRQAYGDQRP